MSDLATVTEPGERRRGHCLSRSRYGRCGRATHDAVHAVPIGDGVWFGYRLDGRRTTGLGYGHLHDGTFTPACDCRQPEGAGAPPDAGGQDAE